MLMLRALVRGVAGIGVVAFVRRMVLVRRRLVHMRGGGPDFRRQARRGVAERQRNAGHEHAGQIEQGGKPPRPGARSSRQANEHGRQTRGDG
jgi:hypothetical protein